MDSLREITQEEFDLLYLQLQKWKKDNKNKKPDFSFIDFRNIQFLDQKQLSGSDFSGSDLSGVDLSGAMLIGAIFMGSNLSGANLINTNLVGANMIKANLIGAAIEGANFLGTNLIEATIEEMALRGVNFAGAIFDNKAINGKFHFYHNERTILEKLEKELQILKLKKKNESENIKEKEIYGEKIKIGLNSSFITLDETNKDINNEVKRLGYIFWVSIIFIAIMLVPLICIWCIAFYDFRGSNFELSKLLLYTSPSLIIISFIFGSVVLMNRSQRQIVSLCKFMRKYNVIKIALEGYYSVQEKHERTPQKAQEVFESIIYENIKENIDTDKEEEMIQKMESKDRFLQKAIVDECFNALSKLKDITKS